MYLGSANMFQVNLFGDPLMSSGTFQIDDGTRLLEAYFVSMRQARQEGREEWQRQVSETSRHQIDAATVFSTRTAFTHTKDVVCSALVEPTLGLLRVCEHVEKSLPTVVDARRNLSALNPLVNGASTDVSDSRAVLYSWENLRSPLKTMELLQKAIATKASINRAVAFAEQQLQQQRQRSHSGSTAESILTMPPLMPIFRRPKSMSENDSDRRRVSSGNSFGTSDSTPITPTQVAAEVQAQAQTQFLAPPSAFTLSQQQQATPQQRSSPVNISSAPPPPTTETSWAKETHLARSVVASNTRLYDQIDQQSSDDDVCDQRHSLDSTR